MTLLLKPLSRESLLPPLENGDRLARAEFERRYDATPEIKKAELIGGRVFVAPPVYERYHGTPHSALVTWASIYAASSPGTVPADNTSLRLLADDELQPDVYLRIMETCGGRTHADRDGYIVGGPEFIAEVAATTASYDLHDKFQAYLRNGVQEYLVWRTYDGEIDWFVLRGDRYDRLPPGSDGIYRSEVFPGLWLDDRALLVGDLLRVLQVLQQGLASAEHESFVARLKSAASQQKG